MKKLFSLLLLSSILTLTSFAQDKIAKGTTVKILEIAKSDSYYSERADFVGKDATALGELTKGNDGFYAGTLETSSGRTVFFTDVKISVTKASTTPATSISSKPIKFITGTIKNGTAVYVAEISPDDSYYTDRFEKVGKKGKIGKSDLTMKEDGYYAGDFVYDDGSTAYFYKAKFSKEPVDKLVRTGNETDTKTSSSDDDDWDFLDTPLTTTTKSTDTDGAKAWEAAINDDDIKDGDKVEITAVSPDDSYYDDRDEYVGKQGVADDDLSYESEDGGYGGTVKLDDGTSPYFFLVKLKKISSGTSSTSSTKTSTSETKSIAKNTKVRVIEVGKEDSFYSSKEKYERKTGKVADGLTPQNGGYYSGKIVFDDGTDAYFFNIKVVVL